MFSTSVYVRTPSSPYLFLCLSLALSLSLSLSLSIYIYIYIYISLSLSLFLFLSHTHTHSLSLSLSLSPSLCLLSVAVPISYEQVANSCLRDILPKLRQAAPAEENPAKKKKAQDRFWTYQKTYLDDTLQTPSINPPGSHHRRRYGPPAARVPCRTATALGKGTAAEATCTNK